jgi:hypothetical protein
MANPKTKRSFGLLERYAVNRRLSTPTDVIWGGAAGVRRLQSLIEPIVADGCTCSKFAAKPPVLVETRAAGLAPRLAQLRPKMAR